NTVVDTNIQLLAREIHDRCLEDFTDGEDIVIEHLVPDEEDGRVVATPTWIHDPSGFVYELFEEQRLADVTATIETAPSPTGPWEPWAADWFLQANPVLTDPNGHYGWDVPEGWWRVRFEKAGY